MKQREQAEVRQGHKLTKQTLAMHFLQQGRLHPLRFHNLPKEHHPLGGVWSKRWLCTTKRLQKGKRKKVITTETQNRSKDTNCKLQQNNHTSQNDSNQTFSKITLNISGLNLPIKKKSTDWDWEMKIHLFAVYKKTIQPSRIRATVEWKDN